MTYRLPFEKYEIYKLSVLLSIDIYNLTKIWPSDEKFGMISQIRRASMSVGANIAEGVARLSEKEKARFIEIAYGSLMEVAHFLFLAKELKMIKKSEFDSRRPKIMELANKINAFHKKLKKAEVSS